MDGASSCGEEEEPAIRGALSTVIQALVKVWSKLQKPVWAFGGSVDRRS